MHLVVIMWIRTRLTIVLCWFIPVKALLVFFPFKLIYLCNGFPCVMENTMCFVSCGEDCPNTANFNGFPLKLAYLCDGFSMCNGGPQCVLSGAVRTVENTALHPVVITAHPVHGQGLEVSLHTDSIRMGETVRL